MKQSKWVSNCLKKTGKVFGLFLISLLMAAFFSHSAFAASDISISSSGTVSFGKVQPSSTGTLATGEDNLSVSTTCIEGANVYASSVNDNGGDNGGNGGNNSNSNSTGTSLINFAAKAKDSGGTSAASYTINTSSAAIGSAATLTNNTWGLNTNSNEAANGNYYGLPAYSSSSLPAAIYSGTNTTIPVYYGAKVTSSLAPGTYTGKVLYTATVSSACLNYVVSFNPNGDGNGNRGDVTGDMVDQSIAPSVSTPLETSTFTRPGYIFLGWSTDSTATTPTYTYGESVTDLTNSGGFITLYAVWGRTMQGWAEDFGCTTITIGSTTDLYDARDSSKYTVRRFSDGSCWMIQNLHIGYDKPYTLTKNDTNISDNGSYYLPQAGKQANLDGTSVADANFSTNSDNQARVQYASADTMLSKRPNLANAQDTGYYNFYAATLGKSYKGLDGIVSGYIEKDICPKGWQLPVNDSNDHRSWSYFYGTLNSGQYANMLNTNGAALLYSGYYNGSSLSGIGSYTYVWSSTVYNADGSYYLSMNSDTVYPVTSWYKERGFAVRCVAKTANATGYMQDFNCNNLASGTSTTLADKRDNQEYSVYRIPTNAVYPNTSTTANIASKCIMTKDLNLGAINSTTGSSSTITANGTMSLSPTDSEFIIPTGSGESITIPTSDVTVGTTYSTTANYSNKYYQASGTGDYTGRGYYSWGAAMVACPKGWRLPTKEEYVNTSSWNASSTGIVKLVNNNLANLQASPYQFVINGYYNNGYGAIPEWGYYWSSTQSSSKAWYLKLGRDYGLAGTTDYKYYGFAVRCITDPYDGYMQDFDKNSLSTNQTAILKDRRDGNNYAVKKLADGNVWMAQNLKLTNYNLTSADSNVSSDFDLTSSQIVQSGSSGWCTDTNDTCYSKKSVYHRNDNNGDIYNWYTATAGTYSSNYDICPKGWRLPTNSEFTALDKAWGGDGSYRTNANTYPIFTGAYTSGNNGGFTLAGYILGSFTSGIGDYWTSTIYDSYRSHLLSLYSSESGVNPSNANYWYFGFSIRCVAK